MCSVGFLAAAIHSALSEATAFYNVNEPGSVIQNE